ncbi:hypothetical protein DERP_013051 [Dermatophagoides pteronyssinus]|uniref:Uncharacterized protein n=1 Tax=Dermatophagoides pteronyssinus TaxID=6956 RepID=A0ABQ8JPT7_DERPT|nr:hypothetical protein DERP_013051 [Dermatophagoides pteronyssinus]
MVNKISTLNIGLCFSSRVKLKSNVAIGCIVLVRTILCREAHNDSIVFKQERIISIRSRFLIKRDEIKRGTASECFTINLFTRSTRLLFR